MENGFLTKTLLNTFLETLRGFGELHGPTVSDDGVTGFRPLHASEDLRLDYQRTQIPPKKYLLGFRDAILNYRDGIYSQPAAADRDVILLGVHPCDLDGIAYLDRVFLGDRPDPLYEQRRKRLTLIGVSCEPDDYCFCSGSGADAPCDLFLSACEGGYEVTSSAGKGDAIFDAVRGIMAAPQGARPPRGPVAGGVRAQDPQLRFSDNPLWKDFAERCVSCGACSVCCPTCYCFDVREYPSLTGDGTRIREWDNCFFAAHGEVAGANFRPSRKDRIRYRFLHKYCGFTPLEGMTSCVGCGRCRKVCPVDIDLRELFPSETFPPESHWERHD